MLTIGIYRSSEMRPGYYVGRVAGGLVAVHIRHSVMDWLHEQVQQSAEIRGILLGSKALIDGSPAIIIESVEAIAPEHGHEVLDTQMKRLRAEGSVVLGFYR